MPRECRLYVLTPPVIPDPASFAIALSDALEAGPAAALQVRLKGASDAEIAQVVQFLAPIVRAKGVPLILNDRPDLAASLGCDGVHVGQSDATYDEARRLVGDLRIVGVTCHASRRLAMDAAAAGADYVAFGAFFPTTTKPAPTRADPEILTEWRNAMATPSVAIGGIETSNCGQLVAAGADFLAVSGGIWNFPRGPAAAVELFTQEIGKVRQELP